MGKAHQAVEEFCFVAGLRFGYTVETLSCNERTLCFADFNKMILGVHILDTKCSYIGHQVSFCVSLWLTVPDTSLKI